MLEEDLSWIGSSPRVSRASERGLILVSVLVIAVLYFALMQLILLESSEKMRGALRFRARVVADLVAEDAVELAAERMVRSPARSIRQELKGGSAEGDFRLYSGRRFRLSGSGNASGPVSSRTTIELRGRISGTRIMIEKASLERSQS